MLEKLQAKRLELFGGFSDAKQAKLPKMCVRERAKEIEFQFAKRLGQLISSVIGFHHIDTIDKTIDILRWICRISTQKLPTNLHWIFCFSFPFHMERNPHWLLRVPPNRFMTSLEIIFFDKFTHSWPQLLLLLLPYSIQFHFRLVALQIHLDQGFR